MSRIFWVPVKIRVWKLSAFPYIVTPTLLTCAPQDRLKTASTRHRQTQHYSPISLTATSGRSSNCLVSSAIHPSISGHFWQISSHLCPQADVSLSFFSSAAMATGPAQEQSGNATRWGTSDAESPPLLCFADIFFRCVARPL